MTLTPIQKLEKLVKQQISFLIENDPFVFGVIGWDLKDFSDNVIDTGTSATAEKAIAALYSAAQKAYPGRLE